MSEFTIDYILNRAGERYLGTNGSLGILKNNELNNCRPSVHDDNINLELLQHEVQLENPHPSTLTFQEFPMLDWLRYTRYHPPKLQRSLRQGYHKRGRTPGRLPRIPFTSSQLHTLERTYKTSHYLSAEEANNLANLLNLSNTRVKIWFQNRRARERREKRNRDENCESTLSSNASSPEPEAEDPIYNV